MKQLTPEQVRLAKINELVESLETMLRFNVQLIWLLGQSQRRYQELEEDYNRLLHSDNMAMLRMYQEAYEHLMLILEVDEG